MVIDVAPSNCLVRIQFTPVPYLALFLPFNRPACNSAMVSIREKD